jgi:hypothetical protein
MKTHGNGWKEAAKAWRVCASVHEAFAKGKDSLYTTRHADFERHTEKSMKKALARDDLLEVVAQILDAGHMNQEDLARLRAAFEGG